MTNKVDAESNYKDYSNKKFSKIKPFIFVVVQSLSLSDSLWPCELQHSRLSCPLLSPRVFSSSCPLSQWCHSTISSSVTPFSFCLQSFPATGSFPVNQLLAFRWQSIGASASALVLPMNVQGWFPLGLTGLMVGSMYTYYSFIYLAARDLHFSMRDLVPWPGIEPWPPPLGAWSFSHWMIREVPSSLLRVLESPILAAIALWVLVL